MSEWVLECEAVGKTFSGPDWQVEVLKRIDFQVRVGESHAIIGQSGAGKSTLMHLLAGLDHANSGEVRLMGRAFSKMSAREAGLMRNRHQGFMYQFHHLLNEFSATENVAMPLRIRREAEASALNKARQILERVGLGHRLEHRPSELSGGERQRVALARALVTQPDCILADEPTGNLDRQNAASMLDLLQEMRQETGTALVIVTHDPQIAASMQQVWQITDGELCPKSAE